MTFIDNGTPDISYGPGGIPRVVVRPKGAGGGGIPSNVSNPFEGAQEYKPPSAAGGAQAGQGDPFAGAAEYQPPQPRNVQPVSGSEAAGKGVLNSASFGAMPVLQGLAAAAGPEYEIDDPIRPGQKTQSALGTVVGAAKLLGGLISGHPDPEVQAAYERGRQKELEAQNSASEQHPWAYAAGQLGGALAIPLGAGAKGVTALGRMGYGALAGGIGGGLYGAGEAASEGQGPGGIAAGAGQGLATGALFGTAGGAGAELVGKGASKLASLARGAVSPEKEAASQVAGAIKTDWANKGLPLTRDEIGAADAAGVPRYVIDAGGPQTKALARTAANVSPEAWDSLHEIAQNRFEQQSPRVAGFIRQITGGADAGADSEALQTAARRANKPAYQRAYAAGDRPIWSPRLEQLTGAPEVVNAIKGAVTRGKNRAINDGYGAFNPGVRVTDDGRLIFNKGRQGVPTYPNLQFWDYAQRELRDSANQASRAGRNEEAGALFGLHRKLLDELDYQVPEFKRARSTAAAFFGADDALEAGRRFVMQTADIGGARNALAKMSPAERELFARGFASNLADSIERTRDNINVINSVFLKSSAAKQKIAMALGPDRARQLETLLRAEAVVDEARKALGNSTTARQLVQLAKAGGHGIGAGGAVAAYEGLEEGQFNPAHILAAALTFGAAKKGAQVIDSRVARHVGELLASQNPRVVQEGIRRVSDNKALFSIFRQATSAASQVYSRDVGLKGTAAGLAALGSSGESAVHGPNSDNLLDQLQ